MSGVDPKDGDALRSVAVELQRRFFDGTQDNRNTYTKVETEPPEKRAVPVVVNVPLDFELKNLDTSHPYLSGRGFTPDILSHFGVGYCSRGVLTERIAIPLRNAEGKILGYAGRVVDDAKIAEDNPKYLMPSRRERGGVIYEFRKSLFLYNGHRFSSPLDELVVVKGFPSVWWLTQCGFPRVVALMGPDCSEEQAEAIVRMVKPTGRIWLMPDGDKAGRRLAEMFLPMVTAHRFVRWVRLEDGNQPTDLSKETLKSCFAL